MPSLIHSPAPDLERSTLFYQKLGFQEITFEDQVYFSDEQLIIHLNTDPFARPGLQLFNKDWSSVIAALSKLGPVKEHKGKHLAVDPNGVFVYLSTETPTFKQAKHSSILGNFAGLSLETHHLERSIRFWNILGFELTHGGLEQGWLSLSDAEGFVVSIMQTGTCPHLFLNPSLTFFNGKENPQIIQKIRATELPIFQEVTHFNPEGLVDNIILQDPAGYGIFVFND